YVTFIETLGSHKGKEDDFQSYSVHKVMSEVASKFENINDIIVDFDRKNNLVKIESITEKLHFQKYWKTPNNIFSNNYFLRNIWSMDGWIDILQAVFLEEFGQEFFDMWHEFLVQLDYWATIFPPPSLPEKYEDILSQK
ncbi:MAG: hypothetical protein J7K61_06795, partial [Thermoplasmata archaeon]|nr:hypothetical protein [Thermoplasmata archaeon]